MSKTDNLSVADIRDRLSEDEFYKAKEKITRAEATLEDLKKMLSTSLFLENGKLSAGNIKYAAFRIETLSLFFATALRSFRIAVKSGEGDGAFNKFVKDLGEEVGFTFARDLIHRLVRRNIFLQSQDMKKLIKLWASFENDTGAGETSLKSYSVDKEIIIELRNNPLRDREDSPHAHCAFYKYYIKALINELFTKRARLLETEIEKSHHTAYKVMEAEEKPDNEDNCVFIFKCRQEKLVKGFDSLTKAYDLFYENTKSRDFSGSMNHARGAIKYAQWEALGWESNFSDKPPRQIYKVFKEKLERDDYKRMDETYQRVSQILHPESDSKLPINQQKAWQILRDVRRTIYAIESLSLSAEEKEELIEKTYQYRRMHEIDSFRRETDQLDSNEKEQLKSLLNDIERGKAINEEKQTRFFKLIRKMGDKAYEIAKPVLTEVLTSAVKQSLNL